MIEATVGEQRSTMMAVAADLADQSDDEAIRGVLYRAFVRKGAAEYLCKLYSWHRKESQEYAVLGLEEAIINNSSKANAKAATAGHLLSQSHKLSGRGLKYLLRLAKADPSLLRDLRAAYDVDGFEVNALWILAKEHPQLYNLLAAPERNYLPARQALIVLDAQLRPVYFRPHVLPFYGTVQRWVSTTADSLAADIQVALPESAGVDTWKLDALKEQLNNPGDFIAFCFVPTDDGGYSCLLLEMTPARSCRLGLFHAVPRSTTSTR